MMRILQINKFLWESGGPERYMFELADLLQGAGHEVLYFAMQHERNRPAAESGYFVSQIDYRNTSLWYKLRTAVRTVGKTVYSLESKRKIRNLLAATRPDLAHLHVISRQISPSILPVLKEFGLPVVQTVHNAELVCPAAHLYLEQRGEVCHRCLAGQYYQAVVHRCVQGSASASLLMAAAQYTHRKTGIFERYIDRFIVPSQFLAGKLVEGGIPGDKIRHLPNFIDLGRYVPRDAPGRCAVFLGRLSPEKGLTTLLKAAALVREVPLVLVGEGPQKPALQQLVRQADLRNVTFAGYRRSEELIDLVRQASFLVLPSECYENCPMVIYEAGALGRPVLASRIGGIPELVDEGETGFLFEPGNVEQLTERMARLHGDPELRRAMGERARHKIEALCASHYERLMAIYHEAREGLPGAQAGTTVPAARPV